MNNVDIDIYNFNAKEIPYEDLYYKQEKVRDLRFTADKMANSAKVPKGIKSHWEDVRNRCNNIIKEIDREFDDRDFFKSCCKKIASCV